MNVFSRAPLLLLITTSLTFVFAANHSNVLSASAIEKVIKVK